MALYNFQKRFVPMIVSGEKRHTIRAKRKRTTQPGETLHLYTGLRQKGARLLMRTRCMRVEKIEIRGGLYHSGSVRPLKMFINGEPLSIDECERLARADGFTSLAEMLEFWRGRTPFVGEIIHWIYPPTVVR